ncbi:MAG: hypothetical protein Q7R60_02075 [bacterium]|nr:hypothetical protein [bacterium]
MAKTGKSKAVEATRKRKLTPKQHKQVAKKDAVTQVIPSSFNILGQVFVLLRRHWKILGGITLVYLILNIVLASGLSSVINNFGTVKDSLGTGHNFSDALSGFGSLLSGSTVTGSESASVLQSVLIILESLVIIWALRQLLADNKFSVKDAYYKSMTPLVPFLLIVFVIIIQLLPITLGAGAVALISSALASSGAATSIMVLVLIPLLGWSIYMLSSSIFALYIVTLPDIQPRQALRSAKKLVKFRRLKIIRRLLFLPIFILLAMAVIVLPLILFVHFLVVPAFYLLSVSAVLFAHAYLYSLYRGLLE